MMSRGRRHSRAQYQNAPVMVPDDPNFGGEDSDSMLDYSQHRRFGAKFKIFVFCCYYIIGTAYFCHFEGWDIIQGLYFVTVTTTTVGYGFFHPTHWQTRSLIELRTPTFADNVWRACSNLGRS
jgi:hypothetical protein